jgi:hypothetical protein
MSLATSLIDRNLEPEIVGRAQDMQKKAFAWNSYLGV